MNSKEQISSVQAVVIVSSLLIAAGITTLPRGLAQEVGTPDGWISVILGGMLALMVGYVVGKLSMRFPDQTFYQYSQVIVGKFLGRVHGIVLIFYFILYAGFEVRIMGELIHMYLLDKTPIEAIMIAFMCVATYLIIGGINPIARLCEYFFPFIVLIMLLTVFFSLRDFKLDNIRPVLAEGILPVLKGIKISSLSFSGFEVMLVLTFFMKEPHKVIKSVLTGIGLTIPLYTAIVVIAIGTLRLDEVKTLTWPMMEVAKAIEIPGGFFERFETLYTVGWVIVIYTTYVPMHYAASLGMGQLLKKDYQIFIYLLFPVIYIVAMYPDNLNNVFKFGDFIGYSAVFIAAVMPSYLWVIAKVRGKGT